MLCNYSIPTPPTGHAIDSLKKEVISLMENHSQSALNSILKTKFWFETNQYEDYKPLKQELYCTFLIFIIINLLIFNTRFV